MSQECRRLVHDMVFEGKGGRNVQRGFIRKRKLMECWWKV